MSEQSDSVPSTGKTLIERACNPQKGDRYERQDGAWVEVFEAGNGYVTVDRLVNGIGERKTVCPSRFAKLAKETINRGGKFIPATP